MRKTAGRLLLICSAALFAACVDDAPTAPLQENEIATQFAAVTSEAGLDALRNATDRYHRLKAATDDGFVLLHPCEDRPGEGPVGTVYVHIGRLLDGVIDPNLPDALIYAAHEERRREAGRCRVRGAVRALAGPDAAAVHGRDVPERG